MQIKQCTVLAIDLKVYSLQVLFLFHYYIIFSAVKWLFAINRIQNKSFCLHNICVYTVYIYYVYLNAHTYSIYFENISMYMFIFI